MTKGGGSSSPTIGPEGGTITSADGRLNLTFPPGALSEETEISIREINPEDLPPEFDGLDPEFAYLLEPDGIVFAVPVTATLMLDEEPAQEDGSLSTEGVLLLTSSNGELEALENLSQEVDGDANMTTVSGELSHFSQLVQTRLGITFSVSGVPDILGVGATFEALVNVDKPGFVDDVRILSFFESFFMDLSIAPISLADFPSGTSFKLPFIIDDVVQTLQNQITYTCDFVGKGVFIGLVQLGVTNKEMTTFFGVRGHLFKEVICIGPEETPPPEPCVKNGFYESTPSAGDCDVGSFKLFVQSDGALELVNFGDDFLDLIFEKTKNPNVFESGSTNIKILGKEGHSCTITCGPGKNQITLKCTNTMGGMCTEVFTLHP